METDPGEHQRLLMFLYQCPVGIAEIDDVGNVMMLNATGSQVLMPLSASPSLDNLFEITDGFAPELHRNIANFPEESGVVFEGFRVCAPAHGQDTATYLDFTARKLGPNDLMVTFSNVTETVNNENQIRQALETLAMQNGRIEIATGVLHDIGNAVTGIGTQVASLLGDNQWPELEGLKRVAGLLESKSDRISEVLGPGKGKALAEYVASIEAALDTHCREWFETVQYLSKTVVHIQEIITIQRNYVKEGIGPPVPLDLRTLADDAIAIQLGNLEGRRIRVFREFPKTLPKIRGDRTRLIQALVNFIKNAGESYDSLEMADDRHIHIRIEHLEDQSRIVLTIRDNGAGFEPVRAAGFFERGSSTKQRGTGFGLSHCRTLIEAHDGTVRLESAGPNTGASLIVEFPVFEPQEPSWMSV